MYAEYTASQQIEAVLGLEAQAEADKAAKRARVR